MTKQGQVTPPEKRECVCSHSKAVHSSRGCEYHRHNGGFGFCPCLITREQLKDGMVFDDDTNSYARSAYVNGY